MQPASHGAIARFASISAVVLMALGCGEWKDHGNGENRRLYFEASSRAVQNGVTAIVIRASNPSSEIVRVCRRESRPEIFGFSLHSGPPRQVRTTPIKIDHARCDPATLCIVSTGEPGEWVELTISPQSSGAGFLTVTATTSSGTSVSDRAAVEIASDQR
jgi:hypothetical protein